MRPDLVLTYLLKGHLWPGLGWLGDVRLRVGSSCCMRVGVSTAYGFESSCLRMCMQCLIGWEGILRILLAWFADYAGRRHRPG